MCNVYSILSQKVNSQVAKGAAPAGSAKHRYELTDKDGLPPAKEVEKVLHYILTFFVLGHLYACQALTPLAQ